MAIYAGSSWINVVVPELDDDVKHESFDLVYEEKDVLFLSHS